MLLETFRISKYRNIQETGDITLFDSLTCIVGKNQSGKTSILQALHKFHPHNGQNSYDIRRDWPRDDRRNKNPKQIVCTVAFLLDESEQKKAKEISKGLFISKRVRIARDYEGSYFISLPEQAEESPLNSKQILGEPVSDLHRELYDYLLFRIPTFIYMDDYSELQGSILLEPLLEKVHNGTTNEEESTFLKLLELAGIDLEELVEQGHSSDPDAIRDRQHNLEDAANLLSNEIAGRWGQKLYRIHFCCDGQKFFTEIREEGSQRGVIPLEEESRGFRWFFSFDLRFMHESRGSFENCILLLDEPGLHLHPGAQDDLLRRLDSYAKNNSILYSTHLPFLIDIREPQRIHIITKTEQGATITQDLSSCTSEEKETLEAALRMQLRPASPGKNPQLIVKTTADLHLLSQLSRLLEKSGEKGLPDNVVITPAGSAHEEVYLSTLLYGKASKVVTLFESNDEGKAAAKKLQNEWQGRFKDSDSAVVLMGKAVGETKDFNLDDLFLERYYLDKTKESHVNDIVDTHAHNLTPVGEGTLTTRMENGCKKAGFTFDKNLVTGSICLDLNKLDHCDKLNPYTRERVRKLFAALQKEFQS